MFDVDRVMGAMIEGTKLLIAKKLEQIEAATAALTEEVAALDQVALGELEALGACLSALEDEVAGLRNEAEASQ